MLLIVIILTMSKNTGVFGRNFCALSRKQKGRENKASQRQRRLGPSMQSVALGHLYMLHNANSWLYYFAKKELI